MVTIIKKGSEQKVKVEKALSKIKRQKKFDALNIWDN